MLRHRGVGSREPPKCVRSISGTGAGGSWRPAKPGGSVAGNLVCLVGPSPLEDAWPCLTSSEL